MLLSLVIFFENIFKQDGYTALMCASCQGHAATVQALITAKVDLDQPNQVA